MVDIFCKIFYVLTFIKEWKATIVYGNNNKTYELINNANKKDIIDKHTRFASKCRLCVNKGNKCLPNINFHKNPTKTMVYNSSTQVFPETVPKSITDVFKVVSLSDWKLQQWVAIFFRDQFFLDSFKKSASHKVHW